MLNTKAFANAAAAVMAIWVVACVLLASVLPDLLFVIAQSWTHSLDLGPLRPTTFTPNVATFLLGFVTAVGLTWVTTYTTITLYNRWAK